MVFLNKLASFCDHDSVECFKVADLRLHYLSKYLSYVRNVLADGT